MPSIPRLREIYLYLAGSCNLSCRHCWIEPRLPGEPTKFLPWSDLEKIIVEAKGMGMTAVKLTGGEPLLHPEAVDIIRALTQLGLRVRMESNGTLIREAEAAALAEAKAFVSVSLDGPNAELHESLRGHPGCFDRARAGMEELRRAGVRFQLITCLYRETRMMLPAMIALTKEVGASSMKINPLLAMGRSATMKAQGELLTVREILDAYHELLAQVPDPGIPVFFDIPPVFKRVRTLRKEGPGTCGVLNILGILHNGTAGLCGIGEQVAALSFGSALELGVKRIWEENPVLQSLREKLPDGLEGVCGRCMFRRHCLGKCVAQTYVETGSLSAAFPFCEEAAREGLFPKTRQVKLPAQVAEACP